MGTGRQRMGELARNHPYRSPSARLYRWTRQVSTNQDPGATDARIYRDLEAVPAALESAYQERKNPPEASVVVPLRLENQHGASPR